MEYCRVCAESTAIDSMKVTSIFEGIEPLACMISELCGLEVLEDDDLPDIVCDTCQKDLKLALNVKRKCLQSDEKLKLMMATENLLQTAYEESFETDTPVISYKIIYEEIIEQIPPEIETTYIVESQPTPIEEATKTKVEQLEPTLGKKPEAKEIIDAKPNQFEEPQDIPFLQTQELIKQSVKEIHNLEPNQSQHGSNEEEEIVSFRCCGCDKIFPTKKELLHHSKVAHESKRSSDSERPFECSICYKRYTTERGFKLHRKNVYQHKNHQCPSCGKRFSNCRVLENHERTHTSLRPFPCSSCSKSFRSKSNLLSHMKLHSTISEHTKHMCHICDKGFSRKSYLKYHNNLLHSEETPFVCSFCPSKFKANANLRLHMRTHTQERPYSCDLCDKTFMYPTDKKRHVLQHSGQKPFKCHDCDKAFTRKTLLLKHRTNCHE